VNAQFETPCAESHRALNPLGLGPSGSCATFLLPTSEQTWEGKRAQATTFQASCGVDLTYEEHEQGSGEQEQWEVGL
jgi:hypothetical protein